MCALSWQTSYVSLACYFGVNFTCFRTWYIKAKITLLRGINTSSLQVTHYSLLLRYLGLAVFLV